MEKQEILTKITAIISDETGISKEEIRADSALMDELDLSSLEILIMIGKMEQEFSVRLNPSELQEIVTVQELAEMIQASMKR